MPNVKPLLAITSTLSSTHQKISQKKNFFLTEYNKTFRLFALKTETKSPCWDLATTMYHWSLKMEEKIMNACLLFGSYYTIGEAL
jgi:hypothetical protein